MTLFSRQGGLVLSLAVAMLAGCSGTGSCRPHTDYMSSRPIDPLRAPSGLEVPEKDMTTIPVPAGPRQPVTRTSDGRCLMEPPSFYATTVDSLERDDQQAQAIVLDTSAFTTEVDSLMGGPADASGSGALVGASRLTMEVAEFLSDWAETWSRREADAWFEFYDPGYFPAGYNDNADWRASQKERSFSIPAVTIVVFETLEVDAQPNGDVLAQFVQRFGEPPNTRSVEKALRLVEGGPKGWSIIGEQIVDVL